MTSEYLVPGAEVVFTGRGKLISFPDPDTAHIVVTDQQSGMQGHWVVNVKQMKLMAVPARHRALKPGQVWETADGMYMVRISRPDLPYRLTPADLSTESGLKTLDENSFFMKYPDAHLVFNPGANNKPTNGKHHRKSLTPDHDSGTNGNGKSGKRSRRQGQGLTLDMPVGMNLSYAEGNS